MVEESRPQLDDFLHPTPEQLQQEKDLGQKGYIPERWLKIEELEQTRIQAALETALQERLKKLKPEEIEQRKQTVKRYFSELMEPPSFENGSYAAARWLNLFEMMRRIIDQEQDSTLVPDVDPRVPFSSLQLDKDAIIQNMLRTRIQDVLGKEKALSKPQLNDCFTNISQEQLDVVADQIALSGLTIFPESPNEHWASIARETRQPNRTR